MKKLFEFLDGIRIISKVLFQADKDDRYAGAEAMHLI
jgi:hypothetical protein